MTISTFDLFIPASDSVYINHAYVYSGKTETIEEMLRSILAQLYGKEVLEWETKGVPFRTHAYVPEVHALTGSQFHEREDEAHIFKVILN